MWPSATGCPTHRSPDWQSLPLSLTGPDILFKALGRHLEVICVTRWIHGLVLHTPDTLSCSWFLAAPLHLASLLVPGYCLGSWPLLCSCLLTLPLFHSPYFS